MDLVEEVITEFMSDPKNCEDPNRAINLTNAVRMAFVNATAEEKQESLSHDSQFEITRCLNELSE